VQAARAILCSARNSNLSVIAMATWKKIVLGILTVVIVTIGGCFVLLDYLFSDSLFSELCATTIIDQVASPNSKLKAVVFQIDCVATTDFNSHVAIVPGNKDVFQKNALPKSFFAADRNHGKAPEGKAHGPEVRLNWLSDTNLEMVRHEDRQGKETKFVMLHTG